MDTIDKLIAKGLEYLESHNYSLSTITHHKTSWNRLRRWLVKQGLNDYDHDVEAIYLKARCLDRPSLTKSGLQERTQIKRLLAISELGTIPKPVCSEVRLKVPQGLVSVYELYRQHLCDGDIRAATIASRLSALRCFLSRCGAKSPDELRHSALMRYLEAISSQAPQTRSQKLYVVRDFVRFLAAQGLCSLEIADALPRIPAHKHSSLPSAYTCDEVRFAYKAIGSGRCPLRDKAIFLLASVMGMRAADIRKLELKHIDWNAKTIRYVQSKTTVSHVLPVPDEVLLSLADYVKNERPAIDDTHVFITAHAPYVSFENSSFNFHKLVSRLLDRAGVNTTNKHHGIHSLRHSAASAMLAEEVPYPVISSVLGHSSTTVTRRYLAIDTENLRPLALEVPSWNR